MNGFLNRCGRHRKEISLHAAGALSEAERNSVEAHLAECAGCRAYFEEMKQMVRPLAGWEENFKIVAPEAVARQRWTQAIMATPSSALRAPSPPLGEKAGMRGKRFKGEDRIMAWLREVFWPYRHAWAGMAAVWLGLCAVNSGMSPAPNATMSARIKTTPAVYQAIAEERQLLAELLPPSTPEPAEKPRSNTRPRGQRQTGIVCC
jgi:anti-sigma factor RsiW